MKLSVIVPVYNAEKYLERCADSILNQSFRNLELIMINDSSPDRSLEIMERYAAEYPDRVKIRTVPNHRQGAARNAGLELAEGEFIGFVDSDDFIEPDMYEKLMSAAAAEDADVAVCDIREWFEETGESVTDGAYDNNRLGIGSCCNKIFRRSAIGRIRFPADLRYEDMLFSAKVMLKGSKITYVNEALYVYRIGHTSTMNNNNSQANLDIIAIMQKLYTFMLLNHCMEEFDYILLNQVLIEAINRVERQNTPDKKDVLKMLVTYVHQHIPDIDKCDAYHAESLNRRIVMKLNYLGWSAWSRRLLDLKAAFRK